VPEFVSPFSGGVSDRTLTRGELVRAIRLDIAAEHEAIHLYMAHAEAIDDPLAKAVLIDIANEEIEHIGEFERLLEIISPEETEFRRNGLGEVDEMAAQVAADALVDEPPATAEEAPAVAGAMPTAPSTIGSLRPQRAGDQQREKS
jgi:rubrerythrin